VENHERTWKGLQPEEKTGGGGRVINAKRADFKKTDGRPALLGSRRRERGGPLTNTKSGGPFKNVGRGAEGRRKSALWGYHRSQAPSRVVMRNEKRWSDKEAGKKYSFQTVRERRTRGGEDYMKAEEGGAGRTDLGYKWEILVYIYWEKDKKIKEPPRGVINREVVKAGIKLGSISGTTAICRGGRFVQG